MFDYRYHALSLAAVLFALAVGVLIGVAIGDSNLVSSAKNGIVHNLNSEVSGAQQQADQLRDAAELPRKRSRTISTRSRSTACSTGRNIGLVFLGGSSDRVNGLVRGAVTQAGGNLATVVAVREPLDLDRSRARGERDALRGARRPIRNWCTSSAGSPAASSSAVARR